MTLDPEMILKSYLDSSAIPHALLFVGSDENVLIQSAKFFVKEVLQRRGCKENHLFKIDHNTHPDVHFISPQSKTGFYSIEQIKTLSDQNSLFPHEALNQFFILKNAERMTEAASNALLKTLEEPSKQSIFILLVENIDQMLLTVVSRLQKVYFQLNEPVNEATYQKELKDLLEKKPHFTYNELVITCEKIQKEFDQYSLKAKKENEDLFFLDKEAHQLFIQIEKWFQNHLLSQQNKKIPENFFFKQLEQVKTALDRSMKLSLCLEYLLLNFVS